MISGKEIKRMKPGRKAVIMGKLLLLVKPLSLFMFLAVLMGVAGHLCAAFITVTGAVALASFLGLSLSLPLQTLFLLLLSMALLRGVLRYAEQACNHYIAFKLLALIRDKVFGALRRLWPAKLEVREKGDLIALITADIELLEVFYAHTISPVLIALIFSGIFVGFIGSYHALAGLVAALPYLGVGLVLPLLISGRSRDLGLRFREAAGSLSALSLDTLRGLEEIAQYARQESRLEELEKENAKMSAAEADLKGISGENTAISNAVLLFFDLFMLLCTLYLYRIGQIDFSALLICTVAMFSSFGPVSALAALGSGLQNTLAAGERVLAILEDEPEVEDISGMDELCFEKAAVENISFSYGEKERILDGFSLDIPRNRIIGIAGKSGSGKSTLLKLLMRFWRVQSGRICISGRDIEAINTENLRNMESFVTQSTELLKDSIRANIRIANLEADEEEIQRACKKASLHDFIMSLPKGYDTELKELGENFSGGERQRIGLARAFLHNAPFMLLDEPTANLDSLHEAVILQSLAKEKGERTVLMVSHRQSGLRIADQVYRVESGRMS